MSTLVETPFAWTSTAAEVLDGVDLTGRRAVVTGAASGIGVETARALAGAGAHVTLAVRDPGAGERVAREIAGATGVDVHALELADPDSIDAFAAAWDGPLHILVNNAGVMALPERTLDARGNELQFAVNHLGHFRLALGLHAALAAADGARIVSLSSVGHRRADVDFDDLAFARRPYEPMIAYGQSKTANVLFAVEADRRWRDEGIRANAVHPGAIIDTNLARHYDPAELQALVDSGRYRFKTVQQGAATSVLVAASPLLDGIGGRYFEDSNEAPEVAPDPGEGDWSGVAPFALDPDHASRLWDVSLDLAA
jgi:NAD(P)-dependent dehydrogenase (short-subunit alcohol dehydrogenase family)